MSRRTTGTTDATPAAASMTESWATTCAPTLLAALRREPDCYLCFAKPVSQVDDDTESSKKPRVAVGETVRVPVHAAFLKVHSPPLRHALEHLEPSCRHPCELPPMELDELPGWIETLLYLYRANGVQPLTWASAFKMLPVLHKYDVRMLLDACTAWVCDSQQGFSNHSSSIAFVLRWLELAEALQLDAVRARAVAFVSASMRGNGMTTHYKESGVLARLPHDTLLEIVHRML